MQASRRAQYGAEDAGWYRADPAGGDEGRAVLETGESGTKAIAEEGFPYSMFGIDRIGAVPILLNGPY